MEIFFDDTSLERCQTSMMEYFAKTVKSKKLFAKSLHSAINVWQGCKYAFIEWGLRFIAGYYFHASFKTFSLSSDSTVKWIKKSKLSPEDNDLWMKFSGFF